MMRSVASDEPVRQAIMEALQRRLDGCGAEVLSLDRNPEMMGLVARVRWGPFRVNAAARESTAFARGGDAVARQIVLDLEAAIGRSIENAIGDFARRATEDALAAVRLDVAKAVAAHNSLLKTQAENLRAEIAELRALVLARRPWYRRFWSWLTTYERRAA